MIDPVSSSSLYGRDSELTRITALLDAVANKATGGRCVLLSGVSGVGKSALAAEIQTIADAKGFDCVSIACEPFHEGMSFFPIRELIRQMAGQASVAQLVSEFYGPASPQATVAELTEAPNADPASRREAMVATFTNAIFGRFQASESRPLCIFIDDLEHLDAGSADALICVVARLAEGPVVVLGAYRADLVSGSDHPVRPVIASARRSDGLLTVVKLSGFSEHSIPALAESVLDGPCRFPPAVFEKLYRETEGNPLFVREVLRTLRNDQESTASQIRFVDGTWTFQGEVDDWKIPASVEQVISTRLDQLDGDQRAELEVAAVVGRRFAFEVMNELMAAGEDELLADLELFLNFDLIRELKSSDDSFEFSHGKIRDVLYESLSGLRKRRIHAQVAEVLEKLAGSTDEDWDALIGEHLFQATDYLNAYPYLLRSARGLLSIGSAAGAAKAYRRAVSAIDHGAVLDHGDTRDSVELEYARSLLEASDTATARQSLERLIQDVTDPHLRAHALNLIGDAMLLDGDAQGAQQTYEECEAEADRIEDQLQLVEVWSDLTELHNRLYERNAGTDPIVADQHLTAYNKYLDKSAEFVDQIPSGPNRARVYRNVAKRMRIDGDLEGAVTWYEKSLAEIDSRLASHRFLVPYAKSLQLVGRWDDAFQAVTKVLQWSEQTGSRRSAAIAHQYLGLLWLYPPAPTSDTLADAKAQLDQALDLHRFISFHQGIRETLILLGEWYLQAGDTNAALQRFAEATDEELTADVLVKAIGAELEANGAIDRARLIRQMLT